MASAAAFCSAANFASAAAFAVAASSAAVGVGSVNPPPPPPPPVGGVGVGVGVGGVVGGVVTTGLAITISGSSVMEAVAEPSTVAVPKSVTTFPMRQ